MIPPPRNPSDKNLWVYVGPQAPILCARAQWAGRRAFCLLEACSPHAIAGSFVGLGAIIVDTGEDVLVVAAAAERLAVMGASPVVAVDFASGSIVPFEPHGAA